MMKRKDAALTTVVSYPERGEGGNNKYRGNCSPKLIEDLSQLIAGKRFIPAQNGLPWNCSSLRWTPKPIASLPTFRG